MESKRANTMLTILMNGRILDSEKFGTLEEAYLRKEKLQSLFPNGSFIIVTV